MEKEISYEEGIAGLNEIIKKLEGGDISMSESIKLFDEGRKLISICHTYLDSAKGRFSEIKEKIDGLEEI